MGNKKQEFTLQIIGEKIESAVKRNAFKELIVIENSEIESNLESVYLIRKEYGHLLNSIWINDKFISLRITEKGRISWCETIDRRIVKE